MNIDEKQQFKPGDLALIVRATHPDNLGKVVELLRRTSEPRICLSDGGIARNDGSIVCWEITCESLTTTRGGVPMRIDAKFGAIPENNLMPLRGDFVPEQQKSREASA